MRAGYSTSLRLIRGRALALALIAAAAAAGCGAPAGRAPEQFTSSPAAVPARTLDELAKLAPGDVSVGRAALIIAKEENPDIDAAACERRLEELADRLRRELAGRAITGRAVARALSRAVYSSYRARPTRVNEMSDVLLPSVLESGTGTCLSMTMLTLAVTERLNLPVKGVAAPRHVFARYASGPEKLNIETTMLGAALPDSFYVRPDRFYVTWKAITPEEMRRGVYLRDLSPKEFVAQMLIAYGTVLAGSDAGRASRAFETALKFDAANPAIPYNLGILAARAGELAAAEQFYDAAIILNPDYAEAYVNRGAARARSGRPREAVADCTKALALDPGMAEAYVNRAGAWGMLGDMPRAEADYVDALKIDPALRVAHLMLARILEAQGRSREAAEHLRKAGNPDEKAPPRNGAGGRGPANR